MGKGRLGMKRRRHTPGRITGKRREVEVELASGRPLPQVVTGETKVVEHGKAEGKYITTTGLGHDQARAGDVLLTSGSIGEHGLAVLAPQQGEAALELCRQHRFGGQAAIIGRVTDRQPAMAELLTAIGGRRIMQKP